MRRYTWTSLNRTEMQIDFIIMPKILKTTELYRVITLPK